MRSGIAPVIRLGSWAMASPWLLAVAAAFTVAMWIVHDVARIAQRSCAVSRRVEIAKAELLADSAAMAVISGAGVGSGGEALPGVLVRCEGASVRVQVRLPGGGDYGFVGSLLPGRAPGAFADVGSLGEDATSIDGMRPLTVETAPRLDPVALAQATSAASTPSLRRDPGIALLHWPAGTDADDFVFAANRGVVDLSAAGELLVVPGHLWIESGGAPLVVVVAHDLVVVVQGNLYLHRSLEVRGPGRLVLVAARAASTVSFADEDGNGRWSEHDRLLDASAFVGPIEGAGSVYCGRKGSAAPIAIAASLVVAGQLHLVAPMRVAGPLVVDHGVTRLRAAATLVATGEWRFEPERERIPGFVTSGAPRPSFLRLCTGADRVSTMREQPLYLSAPAR